MTRNHRWGIGVLTALGLVGCAPTNMVKSGATAQESERDKAECSEEATQAASAMGLSTEIGFAIQKRISLKDCLAKRGYSPQTGGVAADASAQSAPVAASAAVPKSAETEPGLIKMFTGNGVTTTRPFTAPKKWEIQWKSEGGVFGIYLKDGEGRMLSVPVSHTGPGSGSAYQPAGGEFILQVIATESWTVKAVKVEN